MKKTLVGTLLFLVSAAAAGETAHFGHIRAVACANPQNLAFVLRSEEPMLTVELNPLVCGGQYCKGCILLDQVVYIFPVVNTDKWEPQKFPAGDGIPMYEIAAGVRAPTGLKIQNLFVAAQHVKNIREVNIEDQGHALKILYGYAPVPEK